MLLDDPLPVLEPGFLDCGAHSVETGVWSDLPIPEYVDWTCEHHKRFKIIAVPDEIGNPEITKKQTIAFAESVKGRIPTKKLLPIYHMQSKNIEAYRDMLEYADQIGAEWIAIGGALGVGFTPMQKRIALEGIFKHLDRSRFKIHLLGITEPDVVTDFAPDSVDSSKYVWHGGNLDVLRYKDDLSHRKNYHLRTTNVAGKTVNMTSDDVLRHTMDEIWENRHLIQTKFSNIEEMTDQLRTIPHSIRVILANGLHVVEFERKIRETINPNFRHYITTGTQHLRLYSGLTVELFRTIWKERALVAFPQFYGKASNQVRLDLAVFKETED